MKLRIIPILMLLMLLARPGIAQHEISSSAGLEVPMANLTWVYRPTISYNLSYYKMKQGWKTLKGGMGARIGYYNFQSKGLPLDYMSDSGPGKATFGDYTVLMVALCTKFNYEFNKTIAGYFGLDAGYYYNKFEVSLVDPGQTLGGTTVEGKFAIAPKLGLAYNINYDVGLYIQTRYNLSLRIGDGGNSVSNGISSASSSNEEYQGQTDFGSAVSVWSTNVGIYYKLKR